MGLRLTKEVVYNHVGILAAVMSVADFQFSIIQLKIPCPAIKDTFFPKKRAKSKKKMKILVFTIKPANI